MSLTIDRLFWAGKAVVAAYWAWVLHAAVFGSGTVFDKIVLTTAPAVVSMHFLQSMMFARLLRTRPNARSEFFQVLLFGVFHVAPLYLQLQREAALRRKP